MYILSKGRGMVLMFLSTSLQSQKTLLVAHYTIYAMYYKLLASDPRGAGHPLAPSMERNRGRSPKLDLSFVYHILIMSTLVPTKMKS